MVVWSSVVTHLLVGAGSAFTLYKIVSREFSFQYVPYGISSVYSILGAVRYGTETNSLDTVYNIVSRVQDCECLPCLATHYMLDDGYNQYICYTPPVVGLLSFVGLELEFLDAALLNTICCIWGVGYGVLHGLKSRWWCCGGAAFYVSAYGYGIVLGDQNILTAIDMFNILYAGFILCEILHVYKGSSGGQGSSD